MLIVKREKLSEEPFFHRSHFKVHRLTLENKFCLVRLVITKENVFRHEKALHKLLLHVRYLFSSLFFVCSLYQVQLPQTKVHVVPRHNPIVNTCRVCLSRKCRFVKTKAKVRVTTLMFDIPCIFVIRFIESPIPVAERSKARVCGRSPAGIAGSNPAGGMDIYLL